MLFFAGLVGVDKGGEERVRERERKGLLSIHLLVNDFGAALSIHSTNVNGLYMSRITRIHSASQ